MSFVLYLQTFEVSEWVDPEGVAQILPTFLTHRLRHRLQKLSVHRLLRDSRPPAAIRAFYPTFIFEKSTSSKVGDISLHLSAFEISFGIRSIGKPTLTYLERCLFKADISGFHLVNFTGEKESKSFDISLKDDAYKSTIRSSRLNPQTAGNWAPWV